MEEWAGVSPLTGLHHSEALIQTASPSENMIQGFPGALVRNNKQQWYEHDIINETKVTFFSL